MTRPIYWLVAGPAAAGFVVCFGVVVAVAAWASLVERVLARGRP